MAKKKYTTLERSNRAHYRLWHKYDELYEDVMKKDPYNLDKQNKMVRLASYHEECWRLQATSREVMTKQERKNLFKRYEKLIW